ncbi:MAG: hypothetical protein H8E40_05295 [Chloroflexi bacterium]|nr:hypothetical protein [Chloroflexota bacterium]MBL7061317.1 hypothetical protein [Dehalococcoidia bacterium]
MWVQVKSAPNLIIAEMWKEFFEGEGIPTRILPDQKKEPGVSGLAGYRILVSQEKVHVVEEALRKL